ISLDCFWIEGIATAIASDAEVVVGMTTASADDRYCPFGPFRWTPESGMQSLGWLRPEDDYGSAAGVSADGRVVVGCSCGDNNWLRSFRWTQESGLIDLGDTGQPERSFVATGVSGDGSVIVGRGGSKDAEGAWHERSWLWTAQGGM